MNSRYYDQIPSIQTYTGREFFPLDPSPESIDPLDVAHALSMKCRYTGHCRFFYSVAQHCSLMKRWVLGGREGFFSARWALLHDATEAYLPDVAAPIKKHLPAFVEAEGKVAAAVARRFCLPDLTEAEEAQLHTLDRRLFLREWSALMDPAPWVLARREAIPEEFHRIPIEPWSPERAKAEWLRDFSELYPEEEVGR